LIQKLEAVVLPRNCDFSVARRTAVSVGTTNRRPRRTRAIVLRDRETDEKMKLWLSQLASD